MALGCIIHGSSGERACDAAKARVHVPRRCVLRLHALVSVPVPMLVSVLVPLPVAGPEFMFALVLVLALVRALAAVAVVIPLATTSACVLESSV